MNCAELVARLSDYLDGALAMELRATLEAHLAGCADCQVVIDTTRCTILLCRISESPTLPEERRAALLRRLEALCRHTK